MYGFIGDLKTASQPRNKCDRASLGRGFWYAFHEWKLGCLTPLISIRWLHGGEGNCCICSCQYLKSIHVAVFRSNWRLLMLLAESGLKLWANTVFAYGRSWRGFYCVIWKVKGDIVLRDTRSLTHTHLEAHGKLTQCILLEVWNILFLYKGTSLKRCTDLAMAW